MSYLPLLTQRYKQHACGYHWIIPQGCWARPNARAKVPSPNAGGVGRGKEPINRQIRPLRPHTQLLEVRKPQQCVSNSYDIDLTVPGNNNIWWCHFFLAKQVSGRLEMYFWTEILNRSQFGLLHGCTQDSIYLDSLPPPPPVNSIRFNIFSIRFARIPHKLRIKLESTRFVNQSVHLCEIHPLGLRRARRQRLQRSEARRWEPEKFTKSSTTERQQTSGSISRGSHSSSHLLTDFKCSSGNFYWTHIGTDCVHLNSDKH